MGEGPLLVQLPTREHGETGTQGVGQLCLGRISVMTSIGLPEVDKMMEKNICFWMLTWSYTYNLTDCTN